MFSPTHVNVTVHRAFNLTLKGKAGTNDAYVVIQLGTESYKTSVKERTVEPAWHEEYMFPLPADSRNSDVIRVSIFHRNLLSLDDLLGITEIPLYKIRDVGRARVRRYVLYDKIPTRGSFSKGGRSRRRGTDATDSTDDGTGGGLVTPLTPGTPETFPVAGAGSDGSPSSRTEVELSITFTQDKSRGDSHSNLLRPRSTQMENEEKSIRRRSMPSALTLQPDEISSDAKRRNRHSVMSVFDPPKGSGSLRRNTSCGINEMNSIDSLNEKITKEKPNSYDVKNNTKADDFNQSRATNNARPTDIRFCLESPSSSAATTPASSWRSESIITSPESVLTPDSSTEQEGDEKDSEMAKYLRDRKNLMKITRKLPGFMTIDSQEKINKYQPTAEELNLFGGYNREDLISTVIRQHARLTLAETYIGDLEHCVNNLVLRVMESQPKILQKPYIRQSSEPVTSSLNRPAFLRATKKILKGKLNRREK